RFEPLIELRHVLVGLLQGLLEPRKLVVVEMLPRAHLLDVVLAEVFGLGSGTDGFCGKQPVAHTTHQHAAQKHQHDIERNGKVSLHYNSSVEFSRPNASSRSEMSL